MKPDKFTIRNKRIRTLKEMYDEAWDSKRTPQYIPLEYPRFAGWNISIQLCESATRRSDAPDIQAVLDVIGWSKPKFTRYVGDVQFIRLHGRNVKRAITYSRAKQDIMYLFRRKFPHYGDNYYGYVTEKEYAKLSRDIAHYFISTPTQRNRYNTEKVHILEPWYFPLYELEFKVAKAYHSMMLVPDAEAESVQDRLWKRLYSGECLMRHLSDGRLGNYHREYITDRSKWTALCNHLVHKYNTTGETDYMLTGTKINKHKYR